MFGTQSKMSRHAKKQTKGVQMKRKINGIWPGIDIKVTISRRGL